MMISPSGQVAATDTATNQDTPLPIPDALVAVVGAASGLLNGLFAGAAITAIVFAIRGRKRRRR
jgi:hypothetical protein